MDEGSIHAMNTQISERLKALNLSSTGVEQLTRNKHDRKFDDLKEETACDSNICDIR